MGYKAMELGPWFVTENSPESQGQEHFRPGRSVGTWTGQSYVGWACGCHSGLNKTDRKEALKPGECSGETSLLV